MQTVRGFAHSVLGEPLKHFAFIIYNNILTKINNYSPAFKISFMIKKLFSFLKYRTMFIYTILYTGLLIKNSILSSPNVFFLKSGETIKVPTHF